MSFFEDDSFEDIINEFFGRPAKRNSKYSQEQFIEGEQEDRNIDFLEDEDTIYLVFELPGYTEKDIVVGISNKKLKISAKRLSPDNVQSYLQPKLSNGISISKTIPETVKTNNFTKTIRNGILEIKLPKK
jgi:HSP20 family molecular chaperone IbpA